MRKSRNVAVVVWIDRRLRDLLDAYIEKLRELGCDTDRSKLLRAIIIKFLQAKGLIGYEYEDYARICR